MDLINELVSYLVG